MNMIRLLIAFSFLSILSCKEAPKEATSQNNKSQKVEKASEHFYPEALINVFDAHGGLEHWKDKRTLSYEIIKPKGNEVHTIDLNSRKDRIEAPNYSMGFDGRDVWLLDGNGDYKGDPVFYHNLMVYFYAMPFVLADPGIAYGKTDSLEFEGTSYPGVHISFNTGVGTSSKDEYFIHYDPENYQMAWLGYTVTYRSGEKSDNIKWIRYNDWMKVEDLVLPRSITWYSYEGREIKEAKSQVRFENITVNETAEPVTSFLRPKGATISTPKQATKP